MQPSKKNNDKGEKIMKKLIPVICLVLMVMLYDCSISSSMISVGDSGSVSYGEQSDLESSSFLFH
jgi:hypothetical protein